MAKCSLEIKLDRPDRTYRPGEKITGTVVVSVGPDCQCRKITLTATWSTHHGDGEDSASAEGQVLPGAVWHDVEEVSYPFEFRAPAGPLSYRGGELFEVGWSVKAVADMPLGFDATAEEWFNLEHPEPPSAETSVETQFDYSAFPPVATKKKKNVHPAFYSLLALLPRLLALPILFLIGWYVYARREQIFSGDWIGWVILALITLSLLSAISKIFRRAMLRKRRVAQNQLGTRPLEPGEKAPQPPGKYWEKPWATDPPRGWAKIIVTLAFSALGLIFLLTGVIAFVERGATRVSASQVVLLILGLALTLGTVGGVVKSMRILKVRWKVGRVQVNLAPTEVHCGDDLNCSVEFQPAAPVQLDQATARLEAFEVAHYVRNKQPTTRLVRQYEVTLAAGRSLLAQESAVLSGKIPVPPEDPPTFLAVNHKILWFVAVRLQIAGGTNWSTDIPICVLA